VSPGVALYGRIENLLDQDYQQVFGFETAGTAAYAGLRFTYEERASVAWANGR
jgi:vitamin B12 transporter